MPEEVVYARFSSPELVLTRFSRAMPNLDIFMRVATNADGAAFRYFVPNVDEAAGKRLSKVVSANYEANDATWQDGTLQITGIARRDEITGETRDALMAAAAMTKKAFLHARNGLVTVIAWTEAAEQTANAIRAGFLVSSNPPEVKILALEDVDQSLFAPLIDAVAAAGIEP